MSRKKKDETNAEPTAEATTALATPSHSENGDGHKPAFKVGPIPTDRNNAVSTCVWANQVTVGDQSFTVFNVQLETRYRDQQSGEWKSGKSLRTSQIATAIYCLTKCFEYACHERDPQNAPF